MYPKEEGRKTKSRAFENYPMQENEKKWETKGEVRRGRTIPPRSPGKLGPAMRTGARRKESSRGENKSK